MSKKQRIKIIFQQNPDVVYGITKARMFNKIFLREEFKMPTQIQINPDIFAILSFKSKRKHF